MFRYRLEDNLDSPFFRAESVQGLLRSKSLPQVQSCLVKNILCVEDVFACYHTCLQAQYNSYVGPSKTQYARLPSKMCRSVARRLQFRALETDLILFNIPAILPTSTVAMSRKPKIRSKRTSLAGTATQERGNLSHF